MRALTILSVILLAASTGFAGIDVLVAHCDPGNSSQAEANIAHADYDSVTFLDVSNQPSGTTPDVATLSSYDVVLTWSNHLYDDSATMGNNLADYVDGGGKVITCAFATYSGSAGLQGRIASDDSYCPLTNAGTNFGYTALGNFDAAHPIMDSVTAISGIYFTVSCDLEAGATWIADLTNDYDLAAINSAKNVVSFNLYLGDNLRWSGDGWTMVNNAIRYIGDFTVPEVSGQVPADGATAVPVNSDIVFHVTDDMIGVDTSTITFTVEDGAKATAATTNLSNLSDTPSNTLTNVKPEHTSAITGTLTIDDANPNDIVCTFAPDSDLPAGTITCTIATGLADDNGNATTTDIVWSFDTVGSSVEETTWGQLKTL